MFDSQLLQTELTDLLRRAVAMGDTRRMPDQLRSEGADLLHFEFTPEGECRITPVGLESGGGRSPRLVVKGRLRVLPAGNAQAQSRVQLKLSLTKGSWAGVLVGPAVFVAIAILQLFQDPPSFGGFIGLLVGACLFISIGLMRADALLTRAWPGLLAEAHRVAAGTLYTPAV